ncbi:MAG TPA: guanitoxin biosynthesis PLP-dependent transaminase GntE [Anaerolineae bacterium]|nr:guanitoxin biosynthesis PLP-dependent transaminase GntE [Anaerolineae bacterium]
MARTRTRTRELYERAKQVFPFGVNSNFRYWGDDTNIFVRGEKGYVFDADENRYIDYRLAFGPVILGHGYPAVVRRVAEAIQDGCMYAATHPLEISVGERVKRLTGMDKVRFATSGTEATMHALRIARAYTGREVVIKFEGDYHGFHDYLLFTTALASRSSLGSRRSPINVPAGSGIPRALHDLVINLPYNDFEALERTVKAKWGNLAAIIVEPIMGNNASVMPVEGWLEHIRRLCTEYGIVMIIDEVKTGFRIARGGAQEYFGVRGDLATYAKSIANGFPLAAIAGTEEVMSVVGPGSVAHGGTYVGNIPGTAAAEVTLELLEKEDILGSIARRGQQLMAGLDRILTDAGLPHFIQGPPQMFGFVLGTDTPPRDYRDCLNTNLALYEHIIMELIERGAIAEPDCREPWFLCYEHSEADIDETLNLYADAVKAVKGAHG